jgi:hypothetical protein
VLKLAGSTILTWGPVGWSVGVQAATSTSKINARLTIGVVVRHILIESPPPKSAKQKTLPSPVLALEYETEGIGRFEEYRLIRFCHRFRKSMAREFGTPRLPL